jgi:hypothetical protein
LIANFKDTSTLWAFLRASLRQCHIHKLSKVGKDKTAWAKSDEFLTNLIDSDTMLTLENTNDAINRAQNYIDRQDTDGEKHVSFSSVADVDADNEHDEVKALCAALKDRDLRLSALEAKFDSFSHEQEEGGKKSKKTARKECNYCKKAGKGFRGHDESVCWHKQKHDEEAKLQAFKESREGKGRQATKGEKKSFAADDDQHSKVSTSLPVTSPQPAALSATAALDQRRVRHGTVDTVTQLHVYKGARGKGERILLKGITGDTVHAERADVVFPVTTIEGKCYAIFMRNETLVVDKETETLLSVAVLLKAGFDVKFVTGTKTYFWWIPRDTRWPEDSQCFFGDNLWRLPMWSDPVRYTNDQTSPTKRNTLALVPATSALEALAQPSLPDQEAMQLVHDMWCHPGNDKMEQIYKVRRGKGFPRGYILSFANFIVPLARCRSAHDAIDVPSASKWPPPSERRKLARCEHANQALMKISMTPKMQSTRANRRRKSRALVRLSSS